MYYVLYVVRLLSGFVWLFWGQGLAFLWRQVSNPVNATNTSFMLCRCGRGLGFRISV